MASYTGGAKATSRIEALEAERKSISQDVERRKGLIAAASRDAISKAAGNNFSSRTETVEDFLKSDTIGLVTHEDFKARREYLERCSAEERVKRETALRQQQAVHRRRQLRTANRNALSFASDADDSASDDDDGQSPALPAKRPRPVQRADAEEKKKKLRKNPDVDTKFLPDRDREVAQRLEREKLKQEWMNEQQRIKNELVKITYSYWDGAGHRRSIKCKKGTTIGKLLSMVQNEFKELKNVPADSLMFVKEDLIIPHHYSFYDFIVSKARGVSVISLFIHIPRLMSH